MSTERLFDRDPATRTVQKFHFDDATDQVTIQDQQDVKPIIEANKALLDEDRSRGKDMHRVASIPIGVFMDLQKKWREQGLSWEDRQKAMKRWLNDPDNRAFRTTTERV